MQDPSGGKTLYQRDAESVARAEKLRFFPLAATAGDGVRLRTADDREVLDMSASWGAASLGYGHPAVVEAVTRAVRGAASASTLSGANIEAVELAEHLLALTPGGADRRVWLGHSGSDANEAAARLIARATGRPRTIAFDGGYHGCTVGSMGLSAHPALDLSGEDRPFVVPWPGADGADVDAALAALDDILERHAAAIGALFLEPIQSDAGVRLAPAGFLREVQRRCSAHGVLLVSDEVKAGLGRTGWLHAFEGEGLEPDLAVFGKGLGGGLPISAVVGPADVLDVEWAYALTTTAGNPVCSAAALAVLRTLEAEGLVERAQTVGARLLSGLQASADAYDVAVEARGRGLMVALELAREDTNPARSAGAFVARCFELGLVAFYVGEHSNVVELTPPLILDDADCDRALEIMDQALGDVEHGRAAAPDPALFAGW
jgi:4-aminobutyrate aminotransferase